MTERLPRPNHSRNSGAYASPGIGAPAGAAESASRTASSSGPAKSAAFEESALLVGGGAAERAIAVRKTPEPANDVGVHLRVFLAFGIAGLAAERDRAFLVGEAL